jgi:ABC-type phosphate transport system substrate-binding protein
MSLFSFSALEALRHEAVRSHSMSSPMKFLATAACVSALAATVAAQNVQINGAGATFPNPIYSKWFAEQFTIHKSNSKC